MAQIDWYTQDLLLAVDAATDELLTKLAFYTEGEAKVGARVDTGFMRNTIYTIAPAASTRSGVWATGKYQNKAGDLVSRRVVDSAPPLAPHTAAVHCAAEYAIYREIQDSFLYRALEAARAVAPGLIQAVGREKFGA